MESNKLRFLWDIFNKIVLLNFFGFFIEIVGIWIKMFKVFIEVIKKKNFF